MKANEAAIGKSRLKNYNELNDNKQVLIVPNPNSQSASVLGISISITKNCLCVSVLLNTLDIPVTIQRGICTAGEKKCEMTENALKNEILNCPNLKEKIFILSRL